jgi:hypothetical protein
VIGLEEVPCAAEDAVAVAASALQGSSDKTSTTEKGDGGDDDDEYEDDNDEQMEQFLTLEHLCERFKGIDNDATLVRVGVNFIASLNPLNLLLCVFLL